MPLRGKTTAMSTGETSKRQCNFIIANKQVESLTSQLPYAELVSFFQSIEQQDAVRHPHTKVHFLLHLRLLLLEAASKFLYKGQIRLHRLLPLFLSSVSQLGLVERQVHSSRSLGHRCHVLNLHYGGHQWESGGHLSVRL